jgi:hypothetical protein
VLLRESPSPDHTRTAVSRFSAREKASVDGAKKKRKRVNKGQAAEAAGHSETPKLPYADLHTRVRPSLLGGEIPLSFSVRLVCDRGCTHVHVNVFV